MSESDLVCEFCGRSDFKSKSGLEGHKKLKHAQSKEETRSRTELGGETVNASSETRSETSITPPSTPPVFNPIEEFQRLLKEAGMTVGSRLLAEVVVGSDAQSEPKKLYSCLIDSRLSPQQSRLILQGWFKRPWSELTKDLKGLDREELGADEEAGPELIELRRMRLSLEREQEMRRLRELTAGMNAQGNPQNPEGERVRALEAKLAEIEKANLERIHDLEKQLLQKDQELREKTLGSQIEGVNQNVQMLSQRLDQIAAAPKEDPLATFAATKSKLEQAGLITPLSADRQILALTKTFDTTNQLLANVGKKTDKLVDAVTPLVSKAALANLQTLTGRTGPVTAVPGAKEKVVESVSPEFIVNE